MNSKWVFAAALLLFVAISTASVVNLTPDNIDQVLAADSNGILVKFYAPWCGHCKKLAPEYEAAAIELAESGSSVVIAKADCDAHRLIGETYGITGYPTLKWFHKGVVSDYSGGRTKGEIISWIKRNTITKLQEVESLEEIEKLKAGEVFGVVVLFGTNEVAYEELLVASKNIDDVVFVHSTTLLTSVGVENGAVRLYKKDNTVVDFAASTENILDAVSTAAYPKYVEFSQNQFSRLAQQKSLMLIGFAPYDNTEKIERLKAYLEAAADAHPDVGFLYGDSTKFERGLSGAGASLNFLPTFVAIIPGSKQLVWDEEIALSNEAISQWIRDIQAGSASSNKKSEPIPESNNGPVVKLVYKNYNEYFSSGKPLFVKYYAPWCGHCKSMAPDWIKLGETVSKDQVIIAEYDATANYAEVEQIEGFPTLVFYDGHGGKTVYQGDRSFEDLLQFVNAQVHAHSHSHDEL